MTRPATQASCPTTWTHVTEPVRYLRVAATVHTNVPCAGVVPTAWSVTDRMFAALAVDGKGEMPLQDMFWGSYFGSLTDRFGVHWMFNCNSKT